MIKLCQKELWGNLVLVKLKLKTQFFTQSTTKMFCISILEIGHCLASCLIFRPFLMLGPQQLGCFLKKRIITTLYF